MKSKLFHTLVCFGISLGTATGCSGNSSEVEGPGGSTDAGVDPNDAATDAPPDAFCDATWPTTKGAPEAPHACAGEEVAAFCIDGEWQCGTNGSIPLQECRCFGMPPEGYVCTEDGLVPDTG